jgi:hypothetical protein
MRRVYRFTREHSNSFIDPLPDLLEAAFGLGDPRYQIIAILDDEKVLPEALVGHVVSGVETYLGRSVCMVYQIEKDKTEGSWKEMNHALQAIIESWCKAIGLDEIMIMAETESRGRLFQYFGYEKGPVLMRRKFDG